LLKQTFKFVKIIVMARKYLSLKVQISRTLLLN